MKITNKKKSNKIIDVKNGKRQTKKNKQTNQKKRNGDQDNRLNLPCFGAFFFTLSLSFRCGFDACFLARRIANCSNYSQNALLCVLYFEFLDLIIIIIIIMIIIIAAVVVALFLIFLQMFSAVNNVE